MTSFGRGRGWACSSNKEGALRRPGRTISPQSTELSNLINEIDSLVINSSVSKQKLTDIVTLLQNATATESLSSVIEQLYKIALEDRLFGIKLAILCSDDTFISFKDTNGECIRNWFLRVMQIDFEKRDEIREENPNLFQNAASFLGEAYYRLRISSVPVLLLGKPLLAYLHMLLETATLEDIEIATTQIVINGKNLCQRQFSELLKFINVVREVLISRNVCAVSRGMLLLMIELTNQRYAPLSEELQEFYVSQLGSRTLMNMQRHGVEGSNNTKNNNAEVKCDKEQVAGVQPRVSEKVRNIVHNATGNVVPRAIRGSGAGEAGKDHKAKENAKDEASFNAEAHSTRPRPVKFAKPKHEHDDRFEKDYD